MSLLIMSLQKTKITELVWQRIRTEIRVDKEKDELLGAEGRVLPCVPVWVPLGCPVLPRPVGELLPGPGRAHRREKS